MLLIDAKQSRRRGCIYCADYVVVRMRGKRMVCPYDECPYHEMDGYHSYSEYLRKLGPDSVKRIFRRMFDLSDALEP